jgi:5-methyltetrahydrofolate--homocysteine methyltransferase
LNKEQILKEIVESIVSFDIDKIKPSAEKAVRAGIPAYTVVMEGLAKGMDAVGAKYEAGEYFLAELLMAGETMKEGMKVLEPYLKDAKREPIGRVVIGTVRGDLHDIGKNIVATLLQGSGFKIDDLGVDSPPEKFTSTVIETNAHIVAVSALLTTTMPEMGNVIEDLTRAKIRDKVKVIVGGAAVTDEFSKRIGADAYGRDAVEGNNICKKWMKAKAV